jgi:hypothetical protein
MRDQPLATLTSQVVSLKKRFVKFKERVVTLTSQAGSLKNTFVIIIMRYFKERLVILTSQTLFQERNTYKS